MTIVIHSQVVTRSVLPTTSADRTLFSVNYVRHLFPYLAVLVAREKGTLPLNPTPEVGSNHCACHKDYDTVKDSAKHRIHPIHHNLNSLSLISSSLTIFHTTLPAQARLNAPVQIATGKKNQLAYNEIA